jgi:hypothetical protein
VRVWNRAAHDWRLHIRPDQEAFHADLVALWTAKNQSGDADRTVVDAEYLHVVATRSER